MNVLLVPILLPVIGGLLILALTRRENIMRDILASVIAGVAFFTACMLFGSRLTFLCQTGIFGLDFALSLNSFSSFIMLVAAAFVFLATVYSAAFMRGREYANCLFGFILISLGFINGAVLADNLVVMLFFWEGLLGTLFGLIALGGKPALKTAVKAFVLVGVGDLCLMFGIALVWVLTGTLSISAVRLPLDAAGGLAFILMMIGAIAKSGCMPFHTWIPDAATKAPLPFMALFPGALEKLVGIYFLTRLTLDLFIMAPGSWVSMVMMIVGAATIILAVMMALVQNEYKRLLSYHAVSQIGYMVLGIGTCMPAGIVGGLFHMLNNVMYKSCLFLTGGAVEKQAGTTDLKELSGLRVAMPVTFTCFFITALSISGVPPFNGFFSKELVYEGALQRGWIFYAAAALGSFFTAASFLKLGHAVYGGARNEKSRNVKEAPVAMLIPMALIAIGCILFGVYNKLPIEKLIQPALPPALVGEHHFSGLPTNAALTVTTLFILAAALLNHLFGVRRTGQPVRALDHIHYAPGLSTVYEQAEKRVFDPYDQGLKLIRTLSEMGWRLDRAIDWFYDVLTVRVTYAFTAAIQRLHNGNYLVYALWSLAGGTLVLLFILKFF